ncbi:MAG: 50S ribosomal protein L6 [Deltaproteobacteria bacterium]|nr:MAG: 50S ribosomal protein L6 [Deltaproteobacteria bacterium]
MSRIGKKPIQIPEKTDVTITGDKVVVKGKNGTLECNIHPSVAVNVSENEVRVEIVGTERKVNAYQGMVRALINNMVVGVTTGFERTLEMNGIGYRAEVSGKKLVLNLGYSHPVDYPLPEGVTAAVDRNTIKLSSIDKQLLGQTAAEIRALRPPEPYKGKGIKYAEEHIQRKAGKTGAK